MSIPTTITIHHMSRTLSLSRTHNNILLITTTKMVNLILVKRTKSLKPILIICINHRISTQPIILGPIIQNNLIEILLIPIIMRIKTLGHLMSRKVVNKTYRYCQKIFPIAIMSTISITQTLT